MVKDKAMEKKAESGHKQIDTITKEDVKKFICEKATDNEIALFLKIAQMYHLNPFKRELYLVKYGNSAAQIVTGYEVYLKRAQRTKQWNGFKVWTEGEVPKMKAKIKLYRKDWNEPLEHEVDYTEYESKTYDGRPTKIWKEKPKTMLKKVVMSQAFRMAFPDEFDGMPYTRDEMGVEENSNSNENANYSGHEPARKKAQVAEAVEVYNLKIGSDKRKRLIEELNKNKQITADELKSLLRDVYGITNDKEPTSEIKESDYDEIVDAVRDRDTYYELLNKKSDIPI